jgi:TatD DNase family protein
MTGYYDIHAHLTDPRLAAGLTAILAECRRRDLSGILTAAARRGDWPGIVELASGSPDIYGSIGVHPLFSSELESSSESVLTDMLTRHECLVAVGEIGLDFQQGREHFTEQVALLELQLGVAARLGLPAIVHNRKSWNEFFSLWQSSAQGRISGVCHHFNGSIPIARQALDAGLLLSFCGPLTYPQSRRLREAAAFVPLDCLLVDSDTPDLPAQAYLAQGQSRPWHVLDVVAAIAEVKRVPLETVAENIERNFLSLVNQRRPA